MLDAIDGLTGQYGSDAERLYAVHAIAPARNNWHHPSANCGRTRMRASNDPILLPMPSPVRKTTRTMESVYTDAPRSRPSIRVQIDSAASAQSPDNPMTT